MQIQSTKLKVFPTVSRNISISGDINSRHASEEFLTSIVNKFIDSEGFVITEQTDFKDDNPFEFNIKGYYFKVLELKTILNAIDNGTSRDLLPENTLLYAKIATKQNGNWLELAGTDTTSESANDGTPSVDSYEFSGLEFITVLPGDTAPTTKYTDGDKTYYSFIVMMKGDKTGTTDVNWNNTGWYVPATSYLKFAGKSFRIDAIDGGDLSPDA